MPPTGGFPTAPWDMAEKVTVAFSGWCEEGVGSASALWNSACLAAFRYPIVLADGGYTIPDSQIAKMSQINGLWTSPITMRKIKAKYSKRVFVPQESLDLEAGKEVVVPVGEIVSPGSAVESLGASAGGWIGMHDPEQLKRKIYEARIAGSRKKPEL